MGEELYLRLRLDFLAGAQNADGGWGYIPGGPSWLEPTAYAMLALAGRGEFEPAWERGWRLVRSWQRCDGGWKPAAGVDRSHWTTALCITLHCVRGTLDEPFVRGLDWLIRSKGAEGTWINRMRRRLLPSLFGHDPAVLGWPWLPGTGSWVEPTSHAIIALRAAFPLLHSGRDARLRLLVGRLRMGEQMLVQRGAADGGWNYGNRMVLGEVLPSYPETTALALLALRHAPDFDPAASLQLVQDHHSRSASKLARAWQALCLRAYGKNPQPPAENPAPARVHVAALEALGAPEGNHFLLAPGTHQ